MKKKQAAAPSENPRLAAEANYKKLTNNILLIVFLTAVNIVFLAVDNGSYYLFSAFIPYLCAQYALLFGGLLPPETYAELGFEISDVLDKPTMYVLFAVAAVCVLMYVVAYLFARKMKVGGMIFALVFFVLDTVAMVLLLDSMEDSILDLIIHIVVIIMLADGVYLYYKWKKTPETAVIQADEDFPEEDTQVPQTDAFGNSKVLRYADSEEKARILAQAEAYGHTIVYRRIKRTNELVVDGRVYDEYVAFAEFAHTLQAHVNGHKFVAEYDGKTASFLYADGKQIAKKIRLF